MSFIYPYGCTLTVQKPAIAVLSSGSTSYPLNRPVCAFCQTKVPWCVSDILPYVLHKASHIHTCTTCYYSSYAQGKLAVIGSAHLFHDQYIDKEENGKLQDVIFRWLTTNEISLNSIDADDPEVGQLNPPTQHLCLHAFRSLITISSL